MKQQIPDITQNHLAYTYSLTLTATAIDGSKAAETAEWRSLEHNTNARVKEAVESLVSLYIERYCPHLKLVSKELKA